jgi:hypothetical protein
MILPRFDTLLEVFSRRIIRNSMTQGIHVTVYITYTITKPRLMEPGAASSCSEKPAISSYSKLDKIKSISPKFILK